jgi:hypothetical protein
LEYISEISEVAMGQFTHENDFGINHVLFFFESARGAGHR